MDEEVRHDAGGLNEKPKGVRRMNTAASEWAAYVAARNRIETAKAKGRRVPPLTPEEELAATVARQKEAE